MISLRYWQLAAFAVVLALGSAALTRWMEPPASPPTDCVVGAGLVYFT